MKWKRSANYNVGNISWTALLLQLDRTLSHANNAFVLNMHSSPRATNAQRKTQFLTQWKTVKTKCWRQTTNELKFIDPKLFDCKFVCVFFIIHCFRCPSEPRATATCALYTYTQGHAAYTQRTPLIRLRRICNSQHLAHLHFMSYQYRINVSLCEIAVWRSGGRLSPSYSARSHFVLCWHFSETIWLCKHHFQPSRIEWRKKW